MSIKKQTLTHDQMAQALAWVADYMDEHETDSTDELRTAASFFRKYNPEPPAPPKPPVNRYVNDDKPTPPPATEYVNKGNCKSVSIGVTVVVSILSALFASTLIIFIAIAGA